jgi:hypothetical protein
VDSPGVALSRRQEGLSAGTDITLEEDCTKGGQPSRDAGASR